MKLWFSVSSSLPYSAQGRCCASGNQHDEEGPCALLAAQCFSSTPSLSVRLHLADARRLHWRCHSVDHGETRPSAPRRGRTSRISLRRCQRIIPVIRGPYVSRRVDIYVGQHLDAATLEDVDDI